MQYLFSFIIYSPEQEMSKIFALSDLYSDSNLGPSSSGTSLSSSKSIVIDRNMFLDLSSDTTYPDNREVNHDDVIRGVEHPMPSSVDNNSSFIDATNSSPSIDHNFSQSEGSDEESLYPNSDISSLADNNDHNADIEYSNGDTISNTRMYCNVGSSGDRNFNSSSSESSYNPYDPGFSTRNAKLQETTIDVDNDDHTKKQEIIEIDLDDVNVDMDDAEEREGIIDVDLDETDHQEIINVDFDSGEEKDIIFVRSTPTLTTIVTPQRAQYSHDNGVEYVTRFCNFKRQFNEHIDILKGQNKEPLHGGNTFLRLLEQSSSFFEQELVYPDRMLYKHSMYDFIKSLKHHLGIGSDSTFIGLIHYLSTDRVSNTTVFDDFYWGNNTGIVMPRDYFKWKKETSM